VLISSGDPHRSSCGWRVFLVLIALFSGTACSSGGKETRLPEISDGDRVRARRAAARGEDETAAELWRALRRDDPADLEAWLGEGRALDAAPLSARLAYHRELRDGAAIGSAARDNFSLFFDPKLDAAQRELRLEQQLRDDSEDFWTSVFLGELISEKGESARAREIWSPVIEDERFPLCALRGWVETSLAEGENAAALAGLLRLEAAGLDDYENTYNIGTLLLQVDEDYTGAAERFAKARSLRPNELDPLLNLASARLLGGEIEEGRELLAIAEREHPEAPDLHFNLGVFFADEGGDTTKAIAHFERYLELGGEWKLRVEAWLAELRGSGS
jgi:tetratricopeptide (TPR) repeat protein